MPDDLDPAKIADQLGQFGGGAAAIDSSTPQGIASQLAEVPKAPTDAERKLSAAHDYYLQKAEQNWGPGTRDYNEARVPLVGLVNTIGDMYGLSGAMSRYNKGEHTDDDLYTIAQHTAKREYESKKSFGQSAFDMATHVPGLAAEFALSGGLTEGLGEAVGRKVGQGLLGRAAGYGAQTAAATALTPSMYLERAAEQNIQQNRDPLDPRGLAPAYGLATTQMAVLGAVGKLTGRAFAGDGFSQAVGRVATQGATGPIAQAATDVVASAIGLDTGYGTIGKLLDKDYQGALKQATMDAMNFAAFGVAHEIVSGGKGHEQRREEKKPDATMEAYQTALKGLADRNISHDAAGQALLEPSKILRALVDQNPALDRGTVEKAMSELPEGPIRDWGLAIAKTFPEQPTKQATSATPADAARQLGEQAGGENEPANMAANKIPITDASQIDKTGAPSDSEQQPSQQPPQSTARQPEAADAASAEDLTAAPGRGLANAPGSIENRGSRLADIARIMENKRRAQEGLPPIPPTPDMTAVQQPVRPPAKEPSRGSLLYKPDSRTMEMEAKLHDLGQLARENRQQAEALQALQEKPIEQLRPASEAGLSKAEQEEGLRGRVRENRASAVEDAFGQAMLHGTLDATQHFADALYRLGVLAQRQGLDPDKYMQTRLPNVLKGIGPEAFKELLTSVKEYHSAIAADAQRVGLEPASLRRLINERLQKDAQATQAGNAPEGAALGDQGSSRDQSSATVRGPHSGNELEASNGKATPDDIQETNSELAEGNHDQISPGDIEQTEREARDQVAGEIGLTGPELDQLNQPAGTSAEQGQQLAPGVFYSRGSSPQRIAGRSTIPGGINNVIVTPVGGDLGGIGRGIIREHNAAMHQRMERSSRDLAQGSRYFDVYTEGERDPAVRTERFLRFTDAVESGNIGSLPPDQQRFAQAAQSIIAEREALLRQKGYLQTFVDHYMGHIWKDPADPNASAEQIASKINSKRQLAGREAYRKERTIATYREGIEAGLEPATWNPVDLVKLKADEVDRSIFGRDAFNETKLQKLAKFVRLGGDSPTGWRMLDDKLARVLAPPTVKVTEYVDKQQMEGLEKFADSFGIARERTTKSLGKDVAGVTTTGAGGSTVATRFGSPEEVLAHEIGHVIDKTFGMAGWNKDPAIDKELSALADLRSSGQVSPEHRAYLQEPAERMANLVAGYLHAPELTKDIAPKSFAKFEALLQSDKRLAPLADIKPSLELGIREQALRLAGPMLTGNYYMPDGVATAFERHLSPGLGNNKYYRGFREVGNAMNMMQLGWSAFHGMATALNSQFSAIGLSMKMLSEGQAGKAAAMLPKAIFPGYAVASDVIQGRKMRADYFEPGTGLPETQELNRYLLMGGGRARMDSVYRGSQFEAFNKAFAQLKAGNWYKAGSVLARALPALNEIVSMPLMEHLVPLVKNGAFADMARFEMEKLGPNASVNQRREVLGSIQDSVDNRFGQLIYDNLFWNRTFKDILTTGVRSVGWNLGTLRELGGGMMDIPTSLKGIGNGAGVSHRLAYIAGLTMGTAFYGSMMQLMMTGKGPGETRDLFFPKTGRQNKDGTDERVSLPTYMKDTYGILNRADEGPVRIARNAKDMAAGKIHPMLGVIGEMLDNKDFHGAAIDNPNDPFLQRAKDDAAFLMKAFVPFSVRNFEEQRGKGASYGDAAKQFFGITPAPGYITHTSTQQREAESKRKYLQSPLLKKQREGR